MRILIFIGLFLQSLLLFSQNKEKPTFNKIPKEYFVSGTPMENNSLQVYTCIQCRFNIEYVRDIGTRKNYFIVNKKKFYIKEQLVTERMELYNVSYLNKKYLLVLSPDFSSSGKAYSVYKNYYLFFLDKQNRVRSLRKAIDSKLRKRSIFFAFVGVRIR
ncbi:MAG: hypothetical protein H7296_13995 [Bacteroidia bacterium]|nr:hypothetical protein [Bacteroidia bacterium]